VFRTGADYSETIMRKTVERELKLIPGEDFRLSDLGEPTESRVFVSTYHDTSDLRLARHGITLRNRVEDGSRLWQLKIPSGASRIELEVPGPPARPPAELTDLLAVHLRGGQPLVKVARLRTRRQVVRKDGAEIVEDAVAVFEAQRVTRRFRELEIELVGGDERTLQRLERVLRRAGAERGPFTPKLYRALDLPYDGASPQVPPASSPGEAIGLALLAQHTRLLEHDPGTRLGEDPEDLHQMRVATRRSRAFLRVARPLVDPGWASRLREELGWLGSALGPARDADVLLDHVRRELEAAGPSAASAAGLVDTLEAQRDAARGLALTALSDERYFGLLDLLEQSGRPPLVPGAEATLADLWWKEQSRTRKAFSGLDRRSEDVELHAARIRVKRARYAAELAESELGGAGGRFVEAAKRLQDILGEHQDSTVAEAAIGAWAQANPDAHGGVAVLLERERRRRRKARRAWPEAWERVERRARDARL
jgi:CHAD domain-containing protein